MPENNKKKILLVEDEAIIAFSEKASLEKYGYDISIANSGDDAVAYVDSNPFIDLVLMDIDLGDGMDGTQAAEKILESHDLPVVFLSSHVETEIVEKTEKITSYGYVVKDTGITVLDASIKMSLKLFKSKIERMRAEEALKKSEQRYRELYENLLDGSAAVDTTGRIIQCNQRFLDMLGYTFEEARELSYEDITPTRWHAMEKEILMGQTLQRGFSDLYEKEYIHKNKSIFPVELQTYLVKDAAGNPAGFWAFVRDITERKRSEEALRKSEQTFRAIFDQTFQFMGLMTVDGILIEANKAALQFGGIKESDVIGKPFWEAPWWIHSTEQQEKLRKAIREAANGEFVRFETTHPGADGNLHYVDFSIKPVMDETGSVILLIPEGRDITERIETEAALRKKDAMLANISSQVPGMLYQFMMKPDGSLSVPYSSQGVWDVFGCTPEQVHDDFGPIFNAIHPEDRPRILETIEESVKTMNQWKCEYRVQVPGRNIIWVYGNSIPEKLDDGSIIWSGYNVDITERKLVEFEIQRQLQEKESLLREVHHRIKNNITSIENLLLMQMESVSNPEAVSILQDAVSRVKSMRMLYDSLLFSEEYRNVQVKEYFENLINTVSALFPEEKEIIVNKKIDEFSLSSKKLFPLAIIVTELLTNTMKHAFRGRDSGAIDVSIEKNKQKIKLTMHDNGVGFPDGFDASNSQGLGLMLVNMLSKQLGENFIMENINGTRFVLEFEM